MLDNPTTGLYDVDHVLYQRAKIIHKHFEDNNLFYVSGERTRGHVFFDGEYGVEVTKTYVRFLDDVKADTFVELDFNGEKLVRYHRSLKPAIYHPIIDSDYVRKQGTLTEAEAHLLSKYEGLSKYCLYNRIHGWTVDMCDSIYPFNPSASISMHVVKMKKWFNEQFNIISTLEATHSGKRVSSFRFVF